MSGIVARSHGAISDISAADWDACANPEGQGGPPRDPFTTHRFLAALEHSGSVGPGTGWTPRHLSVEQDGKVIAVAPMYLKSHSQGEYVFDHGWADAWQRAGGRYYPKAQIAVPFTPVTGRRLLTRLGYEAAGAAALTEAAVRVSADAGLSSLHITFCTEAEAVAGEAMGLMHRTHEQFHWENPGYADFDDFLSRLSSRKRKTIRHERSTVAAGGLEIRRLTGAEIRPEHWDAFWRFYQDTGSRKWGQPYLTRAFFTALHDTMRDDVLLVMAFDGTRPVAGALNLIGADCLYGRYWGADEHHPFLHFELCYYQAIDFAIAHGLRVEAGAQGEHKLARGYLPAVTHSLHWIADPSLAEAVARFLDSERRAVARDVEILTSLGPFRRGVGEETE